MLRSDTAQLAALLVESVFYGVYLVTFGHCLRALFRNPSGWKRPHEIDFSLLFVALSLFCIGTVNLSFTFYRILDVQEHNYGAGASSIGYLGKPWVNVVKASTMNAQVIIADAVLIYRCWQVHEKQWKFVLFPVALWFAAVGITISIIWTDYTLLHSNAVQLRRAVSLECTTFWVVTIVLNIYATAMIIFRICQADRMMRHALGRSGSTFSATPTRQRPTKLQQITRIIIDSGMMYTATTFAVFCSQLASGNSIYITTSADMMVIGIAFNLINIRVEKARIASPNDADPNTLTRTMMEFDHDLSLAAHASQGMSSHCSRVSSLSEARHVDRSVKESGGIIV